MVFQNNRSPANAVLLLTGFSRSTSNLGPLPLSLAAAGMPGCTLFVSPDRIEWLGGAGNQASWRTPVPNLPNLVGVTLYQQALVFDPAAGNASGAVMSSPARAVIGG